MYYFVFQYPPKQDTWIRTAMETQTIVSTIVAPHPQGLNGVGPPQLGHLFASLLTSLPQSGHLIKLLFILGVGFI